MTRVLLASLFLCCTLPVEVLGGLDPVAVEVQMGRLQGQIQERQAVDDWQGALDLIRAMAAVDPDHPKPFIRLVLLQRSRGALDETTNLMVRLGLDEGPGRAFADGMLAFFRESPAEAEAAFTRALEMYRSTGHAAGQAASHNALGNLHSGARRFDEAVAQYQAAAPFLERIEDRWGLADVHANLSRVERLRGNPAEALAHLRELLSLRVELGDREGQAWSWYEIGSSLLREGDREGALAALENALGLSREIHDTRAQIACIRKLAEVHREMGQGDRSVQRLREALEVARIATDSKLMARVSRQLGETLVEIGRTEDGEAVLEETVAQFRRLEDRRQEAGTSNSLGRALWKMGEHGNAREVLVQSLAAAEELNDDTLIASACIELGNVYQITGEMAQALILQERALGLYQKMEDRIGERISLNNLGSIYFSLGDLERSRRYTESALHLASELSDVEAVALAYNNLGVLFSEEGNLEAALTEMGKALERWATLAAPRSTALGMDNTAEVLLRLRRYDEAESNLVQALTGFREVEDRKGRASVHNHLGELRLASGDLDAALDAHRQALEMAGDFPRQRWRAHAGLAAVLQAAGRNRAAFDEALRAIDEIEQVRSGLEIGAFKMRFLSGKIHHYERALELLIARDYVNTEDRVSLSFELAERARARSLVELLAESGSGSVLRDGIDPGLQNRERRILDSLSAGSVSLAAATDQAARDTARKRVQQAEEDLERLEIDIRRMAPHYGEIAYPEASSLRRIRSEVLADNETLLEYFIGKEKAWLWIVAGHGSELFPLPHPEVIGKSVAVFLESIESSGARLGSGAPDRAAAAELAKAILPPTQMRAGDRLVIVPDGPLHHIPFEALRPGDRFLVEDHEIVIVPSATAIDVMRRQEKSFPVDNAFLGIGDPIPAPGDEQFPRLLHTRQEVESIAALFPEQGRTVLTGKAATKSALRGLALDRYRFVHFATHGWLDAEDLRHSGLRLSAAEGDPGAALLSLNEILALELSADVVVLSACRSGLGELLRGEGLVSLTRALLYAGAGAVVVSLWNVGDQTTADFMQSFYRELEAGNSAPASLRSAKLSFLQSDRAGRRWIRRWAPFVLVGNPGHTENVQHKNPVNRAAGTATESRR